MHEYEFNTNFTVLDFIILIFDSRLIRFSKYRKYHFLKCFIFAKTRYERYRACRILYYRQIEGDFGLYLADRRGEGGGE